MVITYKINSCEFHNTFYHLSTSFNYLTTYQPTCYIFLFEIFISFVCKIFWKGIHCFNAMQCINNVFSFPYFFCSLLSFLSSHIVSPKCLYWLLFLNTPLSVLMFYTVPPIFMYCMFSKLTSEPQELLGHLPLYLWAAFCFPQF